MGHEVGSIADWQGAAAGLCDIEDRGCMQLPLGDGDHYKVIRRLQIEVHTELLILMQCRTM